MIYIVTQEKNKVHKKIKISLYDMEKNWYNKIKYVLNNRG